MRQFAPLDGPVVSGATEVEANPTSSTPELRLTRTLHTLRARTARSSHGLFLTAITPGPAAVAAERVVCAKGEGVTFGEETVLLSPVTRRIRTAAVSADAAAVLLGGEGSAPYAVAATRLELDGRVLLDVPEPYTGKVG